MNLKEELKSLHIQFTQQRALILEALKTSETPLTIDTLMSLLDCKVDLSTLYRTLELFENKHLVIKTELKEPLQNIYEYNRHTHKHHLICTNCKKIQIIKDCPLHEYEQSIMMQTGYIIQDHQLNLYGLCPECQARES